MPSVREKLVLPDYISSVAATFCDTSSIRV